MGDPDREAAEIAGKRSLKEDLARYMDMPAFTTPVTPAVKAICPNVGKMQHDRMKARREIALKRAAAAIRFFSKPENAARLTARQHLEQNPS